jgi:cytochrome-b5 reductase
MELSERRMFGSEDISRDSKVIILDTPDQKKTDVSSFLQLRVPGCNDEKGQPFVRPYTPIDSMPKDGQMVFVVKSYKTGNLSKCLANLKEGDVVEAKGPIPKFKYQANKTKNLVLMAGGSGLTPMVQIIFEILSNPEDKTQITLINCHKTQEDLLLHNMLTMLGSSDQLTVHNVLSQPTKGWKGLSGHVDKTMVENLIPPAGNDTFVCVCGPPGFYQTVSGPKGPNFTQGSVDGILKNLGFKEEQVFKI